MIMTSVKPWDPTPYDNINNTNNEKEWDLSTSITNINRQQFDPDVDYMVTNNVNTHNLECNSQQVNKTRSATFFHPDKITITDRTTSHVISKINLQNTDNVTLHNIKKQHFCPPPFPSNNNDDMLNKQQRDLLIVTNKMSTMIINTTTSNNDIEDNKHKQSSTRTLPSMAYKDLSCEGAAIW